MNIGTDLRVDADAILQLIPSPVCGGRWRTVPEGGEQPLVALIIIISPYLSLPLPCISDSIDFARALRWNPTDAERLLWKHLRRRKVDGFRFRRQRPFGPYVCDFICLEAKLIVELDGSQHVEQATYDARRDDFMRSYGFHVLRFWNGHVTAETEAVLDTIFAALCRKDMDGRYD